MALLGIMQVPTLQGTLSVVADAGSSVVFVGANGSGKTRLGVLMDAQMSASGTEVHRIAAHRSLTLNPGVVPPSLEVAIKRLHYGYEEGNHSYKFGHRYQNKPETVMLSDFDHVLSALYAENNDVSINYRQSSLANPGAYIAPLSAKIDKLKAIWDRLLPHRELIVFSGNIKTRTLEGNEYSSAEMSDGERVVFYLIAQALLAKKDTLLIFDEPELHINRSIIAQLWDEIESARPDCCFLYITHDVEFAASRQAATKYALRSYRKLPTDAWDIEVIPLDSDLPDDVVTTIIGSRRPVLFVEGDGGSLDAALYRRAYNGFTVIPVGSCDHVIHTVATLIARPQLHRVGCAGLVDADGRTDAEAAHLATKGVYRLPVSEVENLLLLPNVFLAIAAALKFSTADAQAKLTVLQHHVMQSATQQIDGICLRYTKRRVDVEMKKIGVGGADITTLDGAFKQSIATIDPRIIFDSIKTDLVSYVAAQDYSKVLLLYDNKGLLSEAARILGMQQKSLEEFIGRALRSDDSAELHVALTGYLPTVTPRP